MKALRTAYGGLPMLFLVLGLPARGTADQPYFEIDNLSGCDIPGGWIQILPADSTVPIWIQYGGMAKGQSVLLLSPASFTPGRISNQNPDNRELCRGKISNPLIVYTITYPTWPGSCPAEEPEVMLPCTINEIQSRARVPGAVPVGESDIDSSITMGIVGKTPPKETPGENASRNKTDVSLEMKLQGAIPGPHAPVYEEAVKKSVGDLEGVVCPAAAPSSSLSGGHAGLPAGQPGLPPSPELASTENSLSSDITSVAESSTPVEDLNALHPLYPAR